MPAAFPSLYLYPHDVAWFIKHFNLNSDQRGEIGRPTDGRINPTENNVSFDYKV